MLLDAIFIEHIVEIPTPSELFDETTDSYLTLTLPSSPLTANVH